VVASQAEYKDDLLAAMQRARAAQVAVTSRGYQLFIPEAILRGIKRSNGRLAEALLQHEGPVAWGNTNSKASDYKQVRRSCVRTMPA
jgi:hypothetical protein